MASVESFYQHMRDIYDAASRGRLQGGLNVVGLAARALRVGVIWEVREVQSNTEGAWSRLLGTVALSNTMPAGPICTIPDVPATWHNESGRSHITARVPTHPDWIHDLRAPAALQCLQILPNLSEEPLHCDLSTPAGREEAETVLNGGGVRLTTYDPAMLGPVFGGLPVRPSGLFTSAANRS